MGLHDIGHFESETEIEQVEAEAPESDSVEIDDTIEETEDGKLETTEDYSDRNKTFREGLKVNPDNDEVGGDGKLNPTPPKTDNPDGGRQRTIYGDEGGRDS